MDRRAVRGPQGHGPAGGGAGPAAGRCPGGGRRPGRRGGVAGQSGRAGPCPRPCRKRRRRRWWPWPSTPPSNAWPRRWSRPAWPTAAPAGPVEPELYVTRRADHALSKPRSDLVDAEILDVALSTMVEAQGLPVEIPYPQRRARALTGLARYFLDHQDQVPTGRVGSTPRPGPRRPGGARGPHRRIRSCWPRARSSPGTRPAAWPKTPTSPG